MAQGMKREGHAVEFVSEAEMLTVVVKIWYRSRGQYERYWSSTLTADCQVD